MADYHYVSTWQLQAPIEQVWAALNDLDQLTTWYGGVQDARELTPGEAQGVGRRVHRPILAGSAAAGLGGPGDAGGVAGGPQGQVGSAWLRRRRGLDAQVAAVG